MRIRYVRSTPHAQTELTENNNDFHTDASLQCELPFRQGICVEVVTSYVYNTMTGLKLHTNGSGGIYAKNAVLSMHCFQTICNT